MANRPPADRQNRILEVGDFGASSRSNAQVIIAAGPGSVKVLTAKNGASFVLGTAGGSVSKSVRGFAVVDDAGTTVAGVFPSYDIASIVAQQADVARLAAIIRAGCPRYQELLTHSRRWFGSRVARWLAAGMPARAALPPAPDLQVIDARMLARNGEALIAYWAAGPEAPARPLYDRLAVRYARAAHGVALAPATARAALEPIHASLALRRLCCEWQPHRVLPELTERPDRVSLPEAAARLRAAARLYRGLDRNRLTLADDASARGRWARACRRSVLLPGVTASNAFGSAKRLLRAADIRHGIDAGEPTRTLSHTLLHLAQWLLVSEQRPDHRSLSQAGP